MTTTPIIATGFNEDLPERVNRAGAKPSVSGELKDIAWFGHLLYNLVYRDLTVRYKRSVLGFFWTMLNPLLLMLIFLVVFAALFRRTVGHYETYFLSEYLPFVFFSQTTVGSMGSLAWNGSLMKRVRVPRSIFALASTIAGLVNLALSFIPLLVIMWFVHAPIRWTMLYLPISFLILGVFTLGVSLALSCISVFFSDVKEMWTVAVQALMYLTPIMYPLSIIPEKYRWVIAANPMTHLSELVRDPVFYGVLPTQINVTISVASALAALVIGWLIFRAFSNNFYAHL